MRYYTESSYLGEQFLYAFYMGMSHKERRDKNIVRFALEVFDLNGTPVYRYTFTEPTPELFVVDERTFNLYGYRGDNGLEDSISVYHLAGLKEFLENQ